LADVVEPVGNARNSINQVNFRDGTAREGSGVRSVFLFMFVTNLAQLLIKFYLRYFSAALLTVAVIIFLVPILFCDTILPFSILGFLLKLLDFFGFIHFTSGSIHFDEAAVMEIFFKLSLVFFIITEVIKFFIGLIIKKKITVAIRTKLLAVLLPLTVIYILALLSVPWMPGVDRADRNGFYFMFISFYILGVAAVIAYFLLQKVIVMLFLFFNKLKIQ